VKHLDLAAEQPPQLLFRRYAAIAYHSSGFPFAEGNLSARTILKQEVERSMPRVMHDVP
jgi:hypothetical protein